MFSTIKALFKRKKAESIIEALLVEIDTDTLSAVLEDKNISQAHTIEFAANALSKDANALLDSVAKRMGLKPMREVATPQLAEVMSLPYATEELKSFWAVPYTPRNGSAALGLACADPSLINVQAFQDSGYEITLAFGSQIEQAWSGYQKPIKAEEKEPTITELLLSLVSQADARGASTLEITGDSLPTYSFQANNEGFSGAVSLSFFEEVFFNVSKVNSVKLKGGPRSTNVTLKALKEAPQRKVLVDWTNEVQKEQVIEKIESPKAGVRKHTLLSIDDDPTFSFIIRTILEQKGLSVTVKHRPKDALLELEAHRTKYDLILCDVHMPEMGGLELLSTVRTMGLSTPFLMLTSDKNPLTEVEAALKGASLVLYKEKDPRTLVAWIFATLNRLEKAETPAEEPQRARAIA